MTEVTLPGVASEPPPPTLARELRDSALLFLLALAVTAGIAGLASLLP